MTTYLRTQPKLYDFSMRSKTAIVQSALRPFRKGDPLETMADCTPRLQLKLTECSVSQEFRPGSLRFRNERTGPGRFWKTKFLLRCAPRRNKCGRPNKLHQTRLIS